MGKSNDIMCCEVIRYTKFTFSYGISSFARDNVKLLFLACTAAIAPDQLVEDGYQGQQQHRKGQQKPVMSFLQ